MLLVLDLETTGLDPDRHAIVEIAAVVLDEKTLLGVDRFVRFVKPTKGAEVSQRALEVMGVTREELESRAAWELEDALADFRAFVARHGDRLKPTGHNVGFDLGFLEAAWRRTGLRPALHYHKVDTMVLAYPLKRAGRVKSLSLQSLADALGVPPAPPHTAMGDVERTIGVLRALLGMFQV